MSKFVLLLTLLILSACSGQEMTPAEKPRVIEKIEMVEFIASHEEAENLTEDDRINPEHIEFELTFLEDPIDSGVHQNQIRLEINVNHEEELLLGSKHFRLEAYDGDEWVEIENVPYGAEDAQAIITNVDPFEYVFDDVEEFDTDFDTGVYRFVNSGYAFPFYVYVME